MDSSSKKKRRGPSLRQDQVPPARPMGLRMEISFSGNLELRQRLVMTPKVRTRAVEMAPVVDVSLGEIAPVDEEDLF